MDRMPYFLSTLAFFVLLGVVVVVHELGHLVIARMNGVFCEAFSFGFGNVLFKRKDKRGTEWRISLLPLGGYVKMLGDADVSSVRETIPEGYTEEDMERLSAHRKKPWQRLLIAAGGPLANFVFAVLVFFALSEINGLPEYNNTISVVSEQSLAYKSGLRTGDVITKANGVNVSNFVDIAGQIKKSAGGSLDLELLRDNNRITLNIDMWVKNGEKTKPIDNLGIAPNGYKYTKVSTWEALKSSAMMTYNIAYKNMQAIFKIVAGKMSTKNVGGIISIFKVTSSSAEAGIATFVTLIAVISAVLGAINLLPIPVLDGGSIAISAIEWIIGRPLNKKVVNAIFTAGLVIVAGLMLLGLWNDLENIRFLNWMENLFK